MSVQAELTNEQIFEIAQALGAEHGKAAGSWVIDGNTSVEAAQAILTGIEEGDPAVMDTMPSPLGSYEGTIAELVDETEIDYSTMDTDEARDQNDLDPFCNGYEAGFTSAYWAEVDECPIGSIVTATRVEVLLDGQVVATTGVSAKDAAPGSYFNKVIAGHAADGTVTIRIEGFSTIYSVDEFMAHLEETDA